MCNAQVIAQLVQLVSVFNRQACGQLQLQRCGGTLVAGECSYFARAFIEDTCCECACRGWRCISTQVHRVQRCWRQIWTLFIITVLPTVLTRHNIIQHSIEYSVVSST